MSEREPITGELRELMGGVEPRVDEDGVVTAKYVTPEAWGEFVRRCDAIDAVHAQLERENAELRERLAVLDNRSESMHIGSATITVTPRLDWTGVARELRAIADTLREVTDPPTRVDLVQVVRCRDCKYCMSYWKSDYCDYFSHVTNDPDGFCAWGERRESE